jgi:hypothetical protein
VKLTLTLLAIGSVLAVTGIALLSIPVALIVAGAALVGFALIREDGA